MSIIYTSKIVKQSTEALI